MTWLASCGQVDYRTHLEIYCPKMKNYTKDFEQELASFIGVHSESDCSVNTGTSALHLTCQYFFNQYVN